jgi:hypothetical protein
VQTNNKQLKNKIMNDKKWLQYLELTMEFNKKLMKSKLKISEMEVQILQMKVQLKDIEINSLKNNQ